MTLLPSFLQVLQIVHAVLFIDQRFMNFTMLGGTQIDQSYINGSIMLNLNVSKFKCILSCSYYGSQTKCMCFLGCYKMVKSSLRPQITISVFHDESCFRSPRKLLQLILSTFLVALLENLSHPKMSHPKMSKCVTFFTTIIQVLARYFVAMRVARKAVKQ